MADKPTKAMNSPDDVDMDLAVESAMGLMFSEEGMQQLLQSVEGNDPVAVVAKSVFMVLTRVRQEFKGQDMVLNDDVFLGEDGAAAQLIVMVFKLFEKELGFKWGDAEFDAALQMVEQDAQNLVQKEASAPPPGAGPQQGPPQQQPQQGPPGLAQSLGGM